MVLRWGWGSRCWGGDGSFGMWLSSECIWNPQGRCHRYHGRTRIWSMGNSDQGVDKWKLTGVCTCSPIHQLILLSLWDACSFGASWARCLAHAIRFCRNLLRTSSLLISTLRPMSHHWSSTRPNVPCTGSPSPTSVLNWKLGARGRRRGHLMPSSGRVPILGAISHQCWLQTTVRTCRWWGQPSLGVGQTGVLTARHRWQNSSAGILTGCWGQGANYLTSGDGALLMSASLTKSVCCVDPSFYVFEPRVPGEVGPLAMMLTLVRLD